MICHQKKFFSLVELMIVIGVIAFLAGMSVGTYAYIQKKNRTARTLAVIEMIKTGLEQYKEKYGFYPPTIGRASSGYVPFMLDKFESTTTSGATCVKDNFNQFIDLAQLTQPGNSVKSGDFYLPLDGFGRNVYYRCPGYINRTSYDLGSLGPDGKVGDGSSKKIDNANAKDDFGKGDDITNCKR